MRIVKLVKNYARIFISSEGEIPMELKKYQLLINPTEIHDILFFADLFIGEGATMASECALLGTPSIYTNSLTAGTLEDQEKNGLIYIFNSSNGLIEKIRELLENPNIKKNHQQKSIEIMKNKIDVNKFFTWIILGYPRTLTELEKNSNIQYLLK